LPISAVPPAPCEGAETGECTAEDTTERERIREQRRDAAFAASHLDGLRRLKHRVHERRLAVIDVSHDRDIAQVFAKALFTHDAPAANWRRARRHLRHQLVRVRARRNEQRAEQQPHRVGSQEAGPRNLRASERKPQLVLELCVDFLW
jgi:hypothetical protein